MIKQNIYACELKRKTILKKIIESPNTFMEFYKLLRKYNNIFISIYFGLNLTLSMIFTNKAEHKEV